MVCGFLPHLSSYKMCFRLSWPIFQQDNLLDQILDHTEEIFMFWITMESDFRGEFFLDWFSGANMNRKR